ncbi:MAG: hypothetical protein ACXAD7_07895 [Candidatus Kariarchaeaceae archaeon]|jgi:hypothetical protein
MASDSSKTRMVGYVCGQCKQTRKLNIDADVHLNRRELSVNGLASYIDVHADKEGLKRHGIKLFIDGNFHVRTNNVLEIKDTPKEASPVPSIPMPGLKTKNLTTRFAWDSWNRLELELKTEKLKFVLELVSESSTPEDDSQITITSELGSVVCNLNPVYNESSPEVLEYIKSWMTSFCNSLELASSLHVDLIPEVLRYLDHHSHRRLTYNDEVVISILIDKAAILIPDKETMMMIAKYGPAMKLIGLNPDNLSSIAQKLCEEDQFSMVDIQKILEKELKKGAELEEEEIVIALFYLITMDAFDYKLSYLKENS